MMKREKKLIEYIFIFFIFTILLSFALVSLFYVPAANAEENIELPAKDPALSAEYIIGMGDQLEIITWNEANLSKTVTVRIDGRISFPLLGDIPAAGLTIAALSKGMEDKLREFVEEPAVSVILLQSTGLRYYVIGKILQPGAYGIDSPITILQAITRSGGFQEWAKTSDIKIVRRAAGKESIINFNYDTLSEQNNLAQNILIEQGDTIIVP